MASRAPSPDELAVMRAALEQLGVTSRSLEGRVRAVEVKRHQVLMEAGDDPDASGLVISGVIREYYQLDDGTERTRGFAFPGDTYGSLSDALCKRPSRVFVRAERDSVVLAVAWSEIDALAEGSLEWERLRHAIVRRLYLRKSIREYELLALDALGRYRSLLEQHPDIEAQVTQLLIASYLGITPVHLSRLRRNLAPTTMKRRAR